MPELKIKNRIIGPRHPCYVIAEMSSNHAGSFKKALAIVRAAKESGADAIKLQTYTPDTITIDCDNKYFRLDHPLWNGKTLYQLYKEAQTPWKWHKLLKKEADKIGIHFFSTPFDNSAVDFLERLAVPAYKIASFELVDDLLLKKIAQTRRPVIMSTGMASLEEIRHAVGVLKRNGTKQLALLRCLSSYPAAPQEMNLTIIKDLRDRFNVVTGLSDHTTDNVTAVAAVALGASIIEKHFKLSDDGTSHDSAFSLSPSQFSSLVRDIRTVESALGKIKYGPASSEKNSLKFRRSIFVVKYIKKGQVFSRDNLRVIRPEHGLDARSYKNVIGKRASCSLRRGTPLLKGNVVS
ncbi:MAG: pseudaminic acid synthase [Candidatus Omnitrophica bacterium]|nr:pseudaminic acid synthase [Candidatus Omnitrophota bacterium]